MLSGSVSGLTSSGLVLAVNSAPVQVASGATTVALASGLVTGTTYSVSVQAQPSGETCSVAGATGTIVSANVANVVVTCAANAYALSGTISGLNGSGLVLANGTDQVTVTSGATTFTLPTQVAYGSSYTVTVKTQPAGLSCAVTGGTGTMPAAAVSTVTVTCTDQPFSVGGTISGLGNTTGLVLTNGTDTLAVPAGATSFAMPTAVPFAGTYNVVATTQPAGEMCTVSSGSGIMGAANVTSVTVVCSNLSFNLGGTISGLSASGLVLGNGSDSLTVTSGSTSFTMPTPVAFGSGFSVQVTTQPSGETCSVNSAGTGTMPAGVVTNIVVTCSLNSYTIGGSISGLSTSGLVLLDNGSNQTTISANASSFTMNGSVASQSTYAVTVQSNPVDVNCTVTGGTGPVTDSIVTTVAVGCTAGGESVLYSFAGGTADGASPQAGMLLASDGKFYGVTPMGGANASSGVLYRFDPTTQTETVLYSFYAFGLDGAVGNGPLIEDSSGNLYGTTEYGGTNGGGGTIFTYNIASGRETTVYSFGGVANDGALPTSGVIMGTDGNLYGVTTYGGANGYGVLYEYNLSLSSYSILYSFATNNGTADALRPGGILIQASDGNFYGLAASGGTAGAGALFQYNPTGSTETVLHSFVNSVSDGGSPQGSLIQATGGLIYGMTNGGGVNSVGTIFSYNLTGPVYSVLYSFGAMPDASQPQGALVQASDGNLYGTTTLGGANGTGAIFEFNPATTTESVLYSFATGGTDGANGYGALVETSNGSLYGVTNAGGTGTDGTIFVLN